MKSLVSAYLLQFSLIVRNPKHCRVDRDVLVLQVLVAFAGLAVSYLLIVDGSVSFSEVEVCHVLDAHDPVQHAAF